METDQQYQSDNEARANSSEKAQEVVPGTPIVRNSTPRPFSFGASTTGHPQRIRPEEQGTSSIFPSRAPSAPPLPEELSESTEGVASIVSTTAIEASTPLPERPGAATKDTQEFVWLFEYGLEMDITILNSRERLDDLALLYGPAVLKGYNVVFGSIEPQEGSQRGVYASQTIVTIVPGPEDEAEVWGVLYRIPRRVTERPGDEPALLDVIHAAIPPHGLFQARQVVVRETYRNREVTCVTYIATDTAQQRLHPFITEHDVYIQRLVAIARLQRLPDVYLKKLAAYTQNEDGHTASALPVEQHTEPLAVLAGKNATLSSINPVRRGSLVSHSSRWLVAFALYLVFLLLAVLTFAVLQGMGFGGTVLTPSFTPLNVPWLVLVYGLLGGCVSSIVTLGRFQSVNPPNFVIITWFTRPYIGAILALFAYLLLNSGFFVVGGGTGQHGTLFLFVGAVAGLCEGWLFLRRG